MIEEKYIADVLGCNTRYLESGSGQPVILISGWLGTADNFTAIMDSFPEGFRCIAVDLPGLGKTSPFSDRSHTVANYSEFIDALVEKFGVEKPIIVGVSLGASIALNYSIKARHSPYKLVLQSPVYSPLSLNSRARLGLWMLENFSLLAKFLLKLTTKDLFRRLIMFFGDSNMKSISFEVLVKYGITGLQNYNYRAMMEAIRDVLSINLTTEANRVRGKVLIIWGSNENLFAPDYERNLATNIPSCIFDEVSGGTHYLFLQKPKLMLERIAQFLTAS